jgi:hypothetical protein
LYERVERQAGWGNIWLGMDGACLRAGGKSRSKWHVMTFQALQSASTHRLALTSFSAFLPERLTVANDTLSSGHGFLAWDGPPSRLTQLGSAAKVAVTTRQRKRISRTVLLVTLPPAVVGSAGGARPRYAAMRHFPCKSVNAAESGLAEKALLSTQPRNRCVRSNVHTMRVSQWVPSSKPPFASLVRAIALGR